VTSSSRSVRPAAAHLASSEWRANWIIQLAMYVFVVSIPFESSLLAMQAGGYTFGLEAAASLSRIAGALLVLAALTDVRHAFGGRSWARWGFLAFGLFSAARLLDNHFRIQYPITITALSISWTILLFFIIAGLWRDPVLRRRSMILLLYALGAVALLQLMGSAYSRTGEMVYGSEWQRVAAFGQDPNFIGAQFGAGLLLALLTALRIIPSGRFTARIAWLFSLLCLVALVQTGSRGAVLSVGLASLALFLGRQTRRNRFRITIAAMVVVAIIAGFVLTNAGFVARFEGIFQSLEREERPEIYRRSIEMAKDALFFGYGPERNVLLLGESFGRPARDTHNILLWALTATGLFGLTLYLIGAAGCLGRAFRARTGPDGVAPLTVGVMAFIFGQTAGWHQLKIFWILMAFSASATIGAPIARKAGRSIRLTFRTGKNPAGRGPTDIGAALPPSRAAAEPALNIPVGPAAD
jgi:O-antigen ligase